MTETRPSPPGNDPDDAEQDAANVQPAMDLRRQRPTWVVVWSPPLRRFSAGPIARDLIGDHPWPPCQISQQ